MKSKIILSLLFSAMMMTCTLSCVNKDLPIAEIDEPSEGGISVESDKDVIYLHQTNKNMILYSLIRYDHATNKYILDAQERERETLGISIEAYEDGQKLVEQMNDTNIERE